MDLHDIPVGIVLIIPRPKHSWSDRVINMPTLTLLGLIYALHLDYPKELANTFDFIQKVSIGLEDEKLRPRVLSLKNDLLARE